MSGVFNIWGQNDEENLAHSDSYSVMEELNVEAPNPKEAVQKLVQGYVTEAMSTGTPLGEIIAPPANNDHWHFKAVDAMDSANVAEFAVRFTLLPALEVNELAPAENQPIDTGDNPTLN